MACLLSGLQKQAAFANIPNMEAAYQLLSELFGDFQPTVGLILGSGLGFFADSHMEIVGSLDYKRVPNMVESTVEGHQGRFVWGKVGNTNVLCMQGRVHYYEGYTMQQITTPVRLMASGGIKTLILTNAAGGIRDDLNPGNLMLICDHINMMGDNPLRGPNDANFGPRFNDMTTTYTPELRAKAKKVAENLGVTLSEGVYLAVSGPCFETPAEIRAYRAIGADAVGMSTVPEAIVARHAGMQIMGISCITNKAAGLGDAELSHEDVSETAGKVKETFACLVKGIVEKI